MFFMILDAEADVDTSSQNSDNKSIPEDSDDDETSEISGIYLSI
jgi:hypothetical protein